MAGKESTHLQGAYIPQELLKELGKVNNRLLIGIPCERVKDERRLALTPEAVDILTDAGHRVLLETGAGLGINYSDNHFSEAGAEIVETPEEVYKADIILKILPPLPSEVALMNPRTTLFSMVQFNLFSQDVYEGLIAKRMNAIAYELMLDYQGKSPILSMISEIEGMAAITIASGLLSNTQGGKGVLLGGVPGIAPTEVLIIGAGAAGTVAARNALAMGATVKVFDYDISKLRTLQHTLGQKIFTSNFHPKVLHNAFQTADVVIGAMSYINIQRRYMIAEDLIRTMKRGALIIDLRVNQGGCFETTCCLSPSDPEIFEQFGVLHYCKPNVTNSVARTTSMGFSNILVSVLSMLGDADSIQGMIKEDNCFRSGVYMYSGKPVNSYISNHFNILSSNLDIYLSAF
ncbi:alanine dehydrogenase [Parabacteroides sp. PF5-5]|uniref:alanine dehydrogenase n=1 Tax=unclassified Parabacteroides TaxID=2649774 RepID=UPI002474B348|nr:MULTISPECIES: NAD(P)-dependent oxidoreductase [unclassified Parabacteroides]MDH6305994.1 alanine dehydrogenase [Parabacteroides sp. PH5-39]MDH6317250.1 alanine dehydrogenase [Parabacteroides sp. PF5-13]MDH6320706.1 alanine dehydrogenase [Parabacteroides sp. PH5-13]MDH6324373.1 alanine dehydrogenase [Parabacteroides sp. PH5-8]MDH6328435.1 alanine dehydrogenase [Parabacteroides sp. PH5-41]